MMRSSVLNRLALVVVATTVFAFNGTASAIDIEFGGSVADQGTGVGNVLGILSLQQAGGGINTGTEWGTTDQDGNGTGLTAQETNFQARTVQEAIDAGITLADGFSIVLQVNEADSPDKYLGLHDFTLYFEEADGTILFSITYTPDAEPQILGGVGQGTSGWAFNVFDFSATQLLFFEDGTNVLRLAVAEGDAIEFTDNGPDNFFLQDFDAPVTVPEPASMMLLGSGLVGLGALRRRRRNK